jgi:tetratricopeptide (TPR) repeat protein
MLWVLPALSAVSLFHGDLFGVQRYAEQQVEIARRVGDRASVAQAVSSMGNAQFLLGDWRRARANLEDGLELARSIDNVQIESFSLFDLGHLTVEEGDWETGERCLHEALQKCLQSGDLLPIRLAHLYLAYLDQARGDPHAVIERLTPLLDRSGHEEFSAIPLLPPLAQAYLDLGEVDRADDIASDALRRTSRQRNRLDLFAAMVVRAGVLDAQDRREEAQGTLQKAFDLAREMSFLPGQAHALFRWGVVESRRGNDEAARSYLRAARDIYQRMGARKGVDMVDEALGKMPLAR